MVLRNGKALFMVGTSPEMRGGIAAVVGALRAGGLFERIEVRYVVSHVEGTPWLKLACFSRALMQLLASLATGRVALVHAHVSSKGSFWRKSILLWLARTFGVRTIFHLHSGGFDEFAAHGWGGRLLRRWIRHSMQASDAVVVLSSRWAEWAREFAPGSRLVVVGNPVALPRQQGAPAEAPSRSGTGRVIYLGLICEAKGCYDLLEAWVRFRAARPGWRLAVGGNGEVEQFLARATQLGVREDVDYLGWVTGDDKDRVLRESSVFVLPSYKEGMPVSVLEAMAYGLAVITTPVGGVPDMMQDGVHGIWVRPGDPQGLAECLIHLAGDAALRERLGTAARKQVTEHNGVDAVIGQLLHLYGDLLQGKE